MQWRRKMLGAGTIAAVLWALAPLAAAGPDHVDLTWMSIANVYFDIADTGVLVDGYVSRIPQQEFYRGPSGMAHTHDPVRPDTAAVERVLAALGGPSKVSLLLTGHSHFDHSFDTAVWSRLTGAPIFGSATTCFQVEAQGIPAARCTVLDGGERMPIDDGVTAWVVRWNHSGDSAVNPEQHNPVELTERPTPDPATGGLFAGLADAFPNGGGGRAFLFVVDGPAGRLSWFVQDSASAVDLQTPIVIDGKSYGAPLENLKAAMRAAGVTSVDLWIGTGGAPVAALVLPVLKPKAYLPVHWDGLYGAFEAGVPQPYSDPPLEAALAAAGVTLIKPAQYMDKWRLDRSGVHAIPNDAVKRALGFVR